jgi:hypothetical protein
MINATVCLPIKRGSGAFINFVVWKWCALDRCVVMTKYAAVASLSVCTVNLLKKNPVKKIFHLRSQDKKHQNSPISLKRNFPLKKYDFLGIYKIFLTGHHCI